MLDIIFQGTNTLRGNKKNWNPPQTKKIPTQYPLMFFSRTNFWKIWKRYGLCVSSYLTLKILNVLKEG